MRALRVVGLEEDGETVICEDPDNGERFTVPADERLRAAARGDLTRLGQVQIEIEAQMRPKEIQTRIRAGASVEQVAQASGLPEQRVERYAYPVLLERAQIAERAQRAHPVREDGPDVQTLGEVVAHTFGMRGHDYNETHWDSWRGEDGKWVVQLLWQAGRSENSAYWSFHPGAQGGTVAPMDEHAADLLDPSPNRPLRTVRPVTALAREALELDQAEQEQPAGEPEFTAPAAPLLGQGSQAAQQAMRPEPPAQEPETAARPTPGVPPVVNPLAGSSAETTTAGHGRATVAGEQVESPVATEESEPSAEGPEEDPDSDARQARKNHPIVPSWEDVLLGVRSHR